MKKSSHDDKPILFRKFVKKCNRIRTVRCFFCDRYYKLSYYQKHLNSQLHHKFKKFYFKNKNKWSGNTTAPTSTFSPTSRTSFGLPISRTSFGLPIPTTGFGTPYTATSAPVHFGNIFHPTSSVATVFPCMTQSETVSTSAQSVTASTPVQAPLQTTSTSAQSVTASTRAPISFAGPIPSSRPTQVSFGPLSFEGRTVPAPFDRPISFPTSFGFSTLPSSSQMPNNFSFRS